MSKTKEELDTLKKEVESLNEKCHELSMEDLEQVSGGTTSGYDFGTHVPVNTE